MIKVKIKIINKNAKIPEYQYPRDAGCDISTISDFSLKPKQIKLVPTGIKMEIPEGYEAQVRPRSGLAVEKGITLLNSPGTIDAGYRGEVKIILINHGQKEVEFKAGDKIAQIVFNKVERAKFQLTESLKKSKRNNKGFGSSG